MDDVHVSSGYRQHLAVVLSRRALERAHARIGRPGQPAHAGVAA
jgi:hypothetical protein